MDPDRDPVPPRREIRLEGAGLLAVGGALLAALMGAFLAGTWYGRTFAPATSARGTMGAPEAAEEPPPAELESTRFDGVAPGGAAAEPGREVESGGQRPSSSPPPAKPASPGGPWFVQVFAGRDRRAAEGLVRDLEGQGYPARLEAQREGRGRLFKVRVGGYPTEGAARDAAGKLRGEGHGGAWVTRNP